MRVAYLGLGVMGRPMAVNIARAGFELAVWNRTASVGHDLAADTGGRIVAARSPADAAAGRDVVCVCLPTGPIVEDVLSGEDGALGALERGAIVVDHSTIAPSDAKALAALCESHGVPYLDAPVSGGPPGAAAGTLSVMVGGAPAALESVRPVVDSYSSRIVHVGDSGQGQVVKLANNLCCMQTTVGVLEAFLLATRNGVDPATVFEVLAASTADSTMLRTRAPFPGLAPDWPASNDFRPGFAADLMAKDLDLALDLAGENGLSLAGTELARTLLAELHEKGMGQLDFSAIWKMY
ncbi:MAG: NAD(P)-dependent oxidoreductase [Actinobacteria bacterium ATB1]|nr:NAD(P)-dependent oxidoreductase [Actinobacteria bacterium ATB1]